MNHGVIVGPVLVYDIWTSSMKPLVARSLEAVGPILKQCELKTLFTISTIYT